MNSRYDAPKIALIALSFFLAQAPVLAAVKPLESLARPDIVGADYRAELAGQTAALAGLGTPQALRSYLFGAFAAPAPSLGVELARRALLDSLENTGALPARDLSRMRRAGLSDLSAIGLPSRRAPENLERLFDGAAPAGFAVGVEIEYSPMKNGRIDLRRPGAKTYGRMLETATRPLPKPRSGVKASRFGKHASGLPYAFEIDGEGRSWKIVPELQNRFALLESLTPREVRRQFDGLELVAPPLRPGTGEVRQLIAAHAALTGSGRYGKAIMSATQFTFSVESLMDGDNVSRLVDAILVAESSWREIYAAIAPHRMGTLVNHYSVPLGANQKDLLAELAALPPAQRTKDRVRAVFLKHEAREMSLAGQDKNAAWKYRALNYKKLFGLLGVAEQPLIELRLPDFASAGDLRRIPRLLEAIFGGKNDWSGARFNDPFPGLSAAPSLIELNRSIIGLPATQYSAFIAKLNLDAADFPPLEKLSQPPSPNALSTRLLGRFPVDAQRVRLLELAALDLGPEILEALLSRAGRARTPDTAIYQLVDAALSQPSLLARRFGAIVLFALNARRYAPLIAKALKDKDAGVRYSALSAKRLLTATRRR